MPQNSITQRHRRARRNYLARRRTVQSEGYIVPAIEIPKRITEGSIRRLEKQTSDTMRRKSRKIETVYEPPTPREQETLRPVIKRYRRARRNYLSRRRTVQSEGYIVPLIKIPKRITEESIRRLEKQTTDYMRLKSRKIETVYEPTTPREQETRRPVTYTPTAERKRQQQTQPPEPDIPDAAKIALERFRETINDVTPRIAAITRNFLAENTDRLDDVAIALMNNPEYQPTPQDSERAVEYKLYLLQNIVDAGTLQQLEDASDVVYEEEE